MKILLPLLLALALGLETQEPDYGYGYTDAPQDAYEQQSDQHIPLPPQGGPRVVMKNDMLEMTDFRAHLGDERRTGRHLTYCDFKVKNLSGKNVFFSLYISLYDKDKKLVACANYSSVPFQTDIRPRQTLSKQIDFGYLRDTQRIKYYQYRIIAVPR